MSVVHPWKTCAPKSETELGRLISFKLEQLRKESGYGYQIEIDGGVTTGNAEEIKAAGTDILVAGLAVFGAPDIASRTEEFLELIR